MDDLDRFTCQMINDNVPLPYITNAMKNNFDASFTTFNEDWIGITGFHVWQYSVQNIFSDNVPLKENNIMEYIHFANKNNFSLPNYYFCKQKYSTDGGYNGKGYKNS